MLGCPDRWKKMELDEQHKVENKAETKKHTKKRMLKTHTEHEQENKHNKNNNVYKVYRVRLLKFNEQVKLFEQTLM